MSAVHVDTRDSDEDRRRQLYEGELFVFTGRASIRALAEFARDMLEDAFAPLDPRTAQFHMPVEKWVEIFAPVKPAFIHHPRTRSLMTEILDELEVPLDRTFLDVPRLRGVTADGYLTSGVGYAHHPHRDTWYSAPMAQLNWWLPIYEFEADSSMAFHPRYWSEGVANGSNAFNYYEWNAVGRKDAAKHISSDTRRQPKAEVEVELEPQVRVVMPVGGLVVFSAAQMHSTVANTTGVARFSIDFRTVSADDLANGNGPVNVDSRPHGTSLRDFVLASDGSPVPNELVERYDDIAADDGVLVFTPDGGA